MRTSLLALSIGIFAGHACALEPINSESRGLGGTVVLSNPSASTQALVPTGGLDNRKWATEASFDRRFELSELDRITLAAAYRISPVTLSVGLSQFGDPDLYSEWSSRVGAAVHVDSLSLGIYMTNTIIGTGYYHRRMTYSTLGAGVSFRSTYILCAITADNLTSPKPYAMALAIEPVYSAFVEAKRGPHSTYSLTGRVTVEDKQKPQYGLGQKVRVSSLGSLLLGISTEPFEFGGGIELYHAGFALIWTTSHHPDLGLSYSAGIGLRK